MRPIPPILAFVILAAMILVKLYGPDLSWLGSPWRWLGAGPIAAGVMLGAWGVAGFRRNGTRVHPGEGHASALVTQGPYRFTRNPMYLAVTAVLLGSALMLDHLLALVGPPLFVLAVDRLWIVREEQWMAGAFGEAYREYKGRVRRWI